MAVQWTATDKKQGAAVSPLDVAVIRCEGEMGEFELLHISEECLSLSGRGCSKVVLDLTAVDHVDYRGVRPLVTRARQLRKAGGDIKLAGLSAYLAAIFRAVGAEDEFELYRNAEEAKAAFVEAPALALVKG